ncbi:MAG: hypothetical protein ACTHO8_12115 [Solirubrobacterales bacterium]
MAPKEILGSSSNPVRAHVLDDEENFAKECAAELEEGAKAAGVHVKATPIHGKALGTVVNELTERSRKFRGSNDHCEDPASLDDCDLLVIDSDLRSAEEAGLVSGTDLAYSARCFTNVGCIVVLNAFGTNPFDLTMLGHRRSFADVNLGSDQLGNKGLWSLEPSLPFRPWDWPLLHLEATRIRERTDWLLGDRLKQPISKLFGLESSELEAIPRSMAAFLTAARDQKKTPKPLPEITPMEFLLSSEYGFLRHDAEAIEKGGESQKTILARTAAARLTKWLSLVAAGQDILVDAPHLAARFPSAVEGKSVDDFNRTTSLEMGESAALLKQLGLDPGSRPLHDHRFDIGPWGDRALWWGQRLGRSDLPEAQKPWEFEAPGVFFCEDASRFLSEEEDPKQFACDLDTPYRIRYIAQLDEDVAYRPRVNLITD